VQVDEREGNKFAFL
jgi:hypothetical protein